MIASSSSSPSSFRLPLHIPPSAPLLAASVRGRIESLLPTHLDIYLPRCITELIDYNCRWGLVECDDAANDDDDVKVTTTTLIESNPSCSRRDQFAILARVTLAAPSSSAHHHRQSSEDDAVPSNAIVVSAVSQRIFLPSTIASSSSSSSSQSSSACRVTFTPVPSYRLVPWQSIRIRIIRRVDVDDHYRPLPSDLHAPFPIAPLASSASCTLAHRPALSQIKRQLYNNTIYARHNRSTSSSSDVNVSSTYQPPSHRVIFYILFLDGQYHAVECTSGVQSSMYSQLDAASDADSRLDGWGIVTDDTTIEWNDDGDEDGGQDDDGDRDASSSIASQPAAITLSIPSLFRQHLPSFSEDAAPVDGEADLQSLALLVKLFVSRSSVSFLPSLSSSPPSSLPSSSSMSDSLLRPSCIMLTGASGCGKWSFLTSLSGAYGLRVEVLSFARLITTQGVATQSSALGLALGRLRDRYLSGAAGAGAERGTEQKCMLVIRAMEMIFPRGDGDADTRDMVGLFTRFMHDIRSSSSGRILVVGLATARSDVNLQILSAFEYKFAMLTPSTDGRRSILQRHLGSSHASESSDASESFQSSGIDLAWVVEQTHGYVGADLVALVRAAIAHAVQCRREQRASSLSSSSSSIVNHNNDHRLVLTNEHFRIAMQRVHPASLKALHVVVRQQVAPTTTKITNSTLNDTAVDSTSSSSSSLSHASSLSSSSPSSTFTSVGGLSSLKSSLRESLLWPLLYPASLFTSLGIAPSRGILLFGVPGVGKTLLARSIASELSYNFITIQLPDLLRAGVGESEKRIRDAFLRARKVAPAIVFLDEIQAIFGKRAGKGGGGGESEMAGKMMSELLLQIDNINVGNSASSSDRVVVLAATNLPSALDPSLLRAGRLDQVLLVPPPDGDARREIAIIARGTAKWSRDVEARMDDIVSNTEGYSGVDMVHLVGRAGLYAVERITMMTSSSSSSSIGVDDQPTATSIGQVEYDDFKRAWESMTPSITRAMVRQCEKWGEKYNKRFEIRAEKARKSAQRKKNETTRDD